VFAALRHILETRNVTWEIEMGNTEVEGLVRRAELEIGQTLKCLELETHQFVEGLTLNCVEANEYSEGDPTSFRHVAIELRHMPGVNWR
jgi:hypothetical protein